MPRSTLLDDYRLMRQHANVSYTPAVETLEQATVRRAIVLARALRALRTDPEVEVVWQPSAYPWDGDAPYNGPLFDALLYRGDRLVESLGAVAVPNTRDPYCRVVEAELYDEFDYRREQMIHRGSE